MEQVGVRHARGEAEQQQRDDVTILNMATPSSRLNNYRPRSSRVPCCWRASDASARRRAIRIGPTRALSSRRRLPELAGHLDLTPPGKSGSAPRRRRQHQAAAGSARRAVAES